MIPRMWSMDRAMDRQRLTELLRQGFANAVIEVNQEGNRFEARIVCESFAGKTMVQRHRQVYAMLGDAFASNEVHALSLSTLTPREQEQENE